MSLTEKINQDLKTAMLQKNEAGLRALRAVKSAILLAKTEKSGQQDLSSDEEMKLLQKLAKQRKDSIDIYLSQGREDLAKGEQEELEIINSYLPAQMDPEELKLKIKEIIRRTGATGAADMGKVMGVASKELAGKADNKTISQFVKELLS